VVAVATYLLLMALMVLAMDSWVWFPFWAGIGSLFVVERLVSVWHGGWRARVLAVLLFPEMFFALFLNLVYLKGIVDLTLHRQAQWQLPSAEPRHRALAGSR
jgi:hypothetical protein